ncbi:MAG: phytanoyl-CoA dioxygenase family protein [Planctomycetota bacterium]|nr:MAG: phytanoyl-CoA dioxygenase family protein [Planctomycetota bacterium]
MSSAARFSDLKDAFDHDGYVVVRSLLPAEAFAELREQIDRYIREVVPRLPAGDAFYDADRSQPESLKQLHRMDQDAFFAAYRDNPTWRGLAEALVGEPVVPEAPEWFNKPPGSQHGTPPHQDNYYFCLDPCRVVTLWMALDAVDDENACLRYVPGSHRAAVRPHGRSQVLGFSQGITDYGPADAAREVAIHLQPGDVVAHHGNLIHRAEANRSTRHRRALAIVYKGVSCRRNEQSFARYLQAVKQQQESLAT